MKFPLVFQNAWLLDTVVEHVNQKEYCPDGILAREVVRKAAPYYVLRISKFLKTTPDKSITAVVSDSQNGMLAEFPFDPTIIRFENQNSQRLTYHTVNCLIIIKGARLKYTSPAVLARDYNYNSNDYLPVLEIMDLKILQRDQVQLEAAIENSLLLVYQVYKNRPPRRNWRIVHPTEDVYDGIVSD